MERGRIPNFGPTKVPLATPQVDYNDDLFLGSFIKSKKAWAGPKNGRLTLRLKNRRNTLITSTRH